MACSVCRKAGHTKRSCPKIEEQKKEQIAIMRNRVNVIVQSPAFNTLATATMYAFLSQTMQRRSAKGDVIFEVIDDAILISGAVGQNDPALVLGAMISQLVDTGSFWESLQEVLTNFQGLDPYATFDEGSIDPQTGEPVTPSSWWGTP